MQCLEFRRVLLDRKSTRLNSSHTLISYAVFCLKKPPTAPQLHLARCLAEEAGGARIRVNTVNPDAVLQGSRIWGGSWREERAAAYDIDPDELEEHYRQRTTLKVNILPDDIAQAVLHF